MSKTSRTSGADQGRVTESGLRVADDALALIANTPLVRLGRVGPAGAATVWAKCELMNPAGSVKDRPALSMVLEAERAAVDPRARGRLRHLLDTDGELHRGRILSIRAQVFTGSCRRLC